MTPKIFFYLLACAVIAIHALYIVWVAVGAAFSKGRPLLRWAHIASLLWGVWIEAGPWPCPLTDLENWLETRAGVAPYRDGFLLHYLHKLVYPDIAPAWLTAAAVVVAAVNLGIYARRYAKRKKP